MDICITDSLCYTPETNQIRSVAQSCPTLCDPMNRSTSGLPVHHQLLEFTQTQIHRVSDAIQPSYPLSSPSPLAPNPSQLHSCHLLFDHFQFALIHGPDIPGSYAICIRPCFYHQSHPQLGILFALAPSLHSFWSYFSTDLQ